MKVAHFGTFDVDNYGDLLFPHIAEWRLPDFQWVHVSPSTNKSFFSDALKTVGFKKLPEDIYNAVIVGGGNIFHMQKSSVEIYRNQPESYAGLWAGAARLASDKKAAYLINAPSIPNKNHGIVERFLMRNVIKSSCYSAFRDSVSKEMSDRITGVSTSKLVPDTAFDISRMWSFSECHKKNHERNYFIVHVNKRYGGAAIEAASSIDKIAYFLNAEPRFIPIGPCHNDIEYMNEVSRLLTVRYSKITNFELKNFAKEIAGAKAYLGSSMHGFITAISYKVPCALVLDEAPMHKFQGVLGFSNIPLEAVNCSWKKAAISIKHGGLHVSDSLKDIHEKLDEHWELVRSCVTGDDICNLSLVCKRWNFLRTLSQFEHFSKSFAVRVKDRFY